MRRFSSSAARYPRKVVPAYTGGAGTVSNAGWLAGDSVVIGAGTTFVLDCDTPVLTSLDIQGTLIANLQRDCSITAGYINIGAAGTLQIGSELIPYFKKATITLTGTEVSRAARFVADITSTSGAGDGTLKRLAAVSGAVAETITITFSSSTAFSVNGSVSGSLGSGTVGTLFSNKIRFVATAGTTAWVSTATQVVGVVSLGFSNSGTPRSIQVQPGGKLILQGSPPIVKRTRVNANVINGNSSLTIADSVGWGKSDRIVVGPTDYYGTTSGTSEQLWVDSGSYGNTTPTKGTVTNSKWGVLQYPTDSGMSLTPGTLTDTEGVGSAWSSIPSVLDQRAPVINLTRNIVIQGIDDSSWQTNAFGAHVMVMGLSSTTQINGVEFRRVGQAGAIGRYPFHWHMLSYNMPDGMTFPSDGTFLGQASNTTNYLKNCSIHQSSQRAIVIHGTHGVLVDSNVCYDIIGHAIFLEDGAEKNNTITNNVVIKVRSPILANRLLKHDGTDAQSSGYWHSNPANIFQNNWAADCQGVGIWNAFGASRCFGLCLDVAEIPKTTQITLHDGNMSHSNDIGMQTENPPINNQGQILPGIYSPPSEFTITNQKLWKNTTGGYKNRILLGRYTSWTQADNESQDFFGASQQTSVMEKMLLIGESLNNSTSRAVSTRKNAMASYHETLLPTNCVAINYPIISPPNNSLGGYGLNNPVKQGGGFMSFGDLYIAGMFSFSGFDKNKYVNTHFGFRTLPPNIDGQPLNPTETGGLARSYTFAGAVKDASNSFKNGVNKYYIFNDTFLTYDAVNLVDEPPSGVSQGLAGKRTDTLYYGITCQGTTETGPMQDTWIKRFYAERLNVSTNTQVATWEILDGTGSWGLQWMRNCSVAKDGKYKLTLGGTIPTGFVWLKTSYCVSGSDSYTLGVQFSGATVARVYIESNFYYSGSVTTVAPNAQNITDGKCRVYNSTGMTSINNVHADTTGTKFWQDTANNLVWIRVKGGLVNVNDTSPAASFHIIVNTA